MKRHTPAPWHAHCAVVNGRDTMFSRCDVVAGGKRVAQVAGIGDDEANANARLVAAAPDLLDALSRLVAASDQFVRETGLKHGDLITDAVDASRAALAKAQSGFTTMRALFVVYALGLILVAPLPLLHAYSVNATCSTDAQCVELCVRQGRDSREACNETLLEGGR